MRITLAARSGENRKTFFIFGLVFWLTLLTAAFYFAWNARADDALSISKVQFDGGSGKADEDFIEITNSSSEDMDLKGYRLAKITASGKKYTLKSWTTDASVPAREKYVWACSKNGFADSIGADASTSETISQDNEIELILGGLDDGAVVDKYARQDDGGDSGDDKGNNTDENDSSGGTDEKSKYAEGVKINEIYPAPDTRAGQKEFVEIKYADDKDIDFSKWCLEDETEHKKGSGGKCKKIDELKTAENFAVFYGTLSLNNDSKGDTVYLLDSDNKLVASRSYAATKSQKAYAFDGQAWRWTSQPTPGAENKFDKIPKIKIEKDDEIYKGMYAYFSVSAEDKNKDTKFTWDFGDGHKSYLQDTKHKYSDTGTYQASLRVHDKKIDESLEFEVEIKKYKAPKIRIVSFSANPQGSDTDNEWIEIENKSKKKVNLKDWSIATGWDKLYNHPIRKDFKIKPGKTKKLTRDSCAFTLANTKDKIELRSPDGKTVQKIKYDHGKKSIAEDEIYQKNKKGWDWIASPDIAPENAPPKTPPDASASSSMGRIYAAPTETSTTNHAVPQEYLGEYSTSPEWQNKISNRNNLVNYNLAVKFTLAENSPRVAGAATMKNIYSPPHQHWLVAWLDSLWMEINSGMNYFLNIVL